MRGFVEKNTDKVVLTFLEHTSESILEVEYRLLLLL